MTHPDLWDQPRFDGATYDRAHDQARLSTALGRVVALMADGQWRTLREIAEHVGCSEAGASARLRDLRKPRFGGRTVEKRRRGDPTIGCWEYRVAR